MATPFNINEFFAPQLRLREGPSDSTFKPAPEIKPAGDELGADGGDIADPIDPGMTQDVAPADPADMSFFVKNAQSVASKYPELPADGVVGLAEGLDTFAFDIYSQVQDPAARQAFEADYQKLAADFGRDMAKFLEKAAGLKKHIG